MGNCCGGSAAVPSDSPPQPVPAPTQATVPSPHPTPSSNVASSPGLVPAHDTTQQDYEMNTLSYNHGAVASERQDSTPSQRRGDDRDHPPPSPPSASNPHSQETNSYLYKPRGKPSPRLHKSVSVDTPFPQRPRSHSPSRMTRTSSTVLSGHGPQPTDTQSESGQAPGTGQMPADRQERRPRFPSTLQSLLSNDFRCVARGCAVSHK